MLEYLRKRQREAKAQEVGTEQTVGPAGMSNQAMISMLESQREQPAARPASGGTPLADAMRAKFERQFGLPMDDVRIHRNSAEPAKFDAGAYTYGTDIFIGPGQEELLNHEMTHVAQQKMGQVRPTGMENGLAVNRSPALEHSADTGAVTQTMGTAAGPVVQCGGLSDLIKWLFSCCTCDNESGLDSETVPLLQSEHNVQGETNSDNTAVPQPMKTIEKPVEQRGCSFDSDTYEKDLENFKDWKAKMKSSDGEPTDKASSELERALEAFTPDKFSAVTINKENKTGSFYFGGTNDFLSSQDLANEENPTGSPIAGGRIRGPHPWGPTFAFHGAVYRRNIKDDNGKGEERAEEYFGDYKTIAENIQKSSANHTSRGILKEVTEEERSEENIKEGIEDLIYRVAFARTMMKNAIEERRKIEEEYYKRLSKDGISDEEKEKLKNERNKKIAECREKYKEEISRANSFLAKTTDNALLKKYPMNDG